MSSTVRIDMADMPVQYPEKAVDAVEARARFFNSGNAFNQKLPRVPATSFDAERDCAFAAFEARATRLFACDQSRTISSAEPATTPLMLAHYAAVGPDAPLEMRPRATGCIWYVIRGAGSTKVGLENFDWAQGDVFLTPGGTRHATSQRRKWRPALASDGRAAIRVRPDDSRTLREPPRRSLSRS